jgi:hypothetical protein
MVRNAQIHISVRVLFERDRFAHLDLGACAAIEQARCHCPIDGSCRRVFRMKPRTGPRPAVTIAFPSRRKIDIIVALRRSLLTNLFCQSARASAGRGPALERMKK